MGLISSGGSGIGRDAKFLAVACMLNAQWVVRLLMVSLRQTARSGGRARWFRAECFRANARALRDYASVKGTERRMRAESSRTIRVHATLHRVAERAGWILRTLPRRCSRGPH